MGCCRPAVIAAMLYAQLPIILYSKLPGQEDGNVDFVVAEGAGIWAPTPAQIVTALRKWIYYPEKRDQAVAACRLGAEVTMVGRVGNDLFGKQMLETLASYGVGCGFISTDEESGSGVALVTVDKKPENVIVVVPGTNMRITTQDVIAAAAKIRDADVLLLQLEVPLNVVECAADIALQSNTICILNPAPARPVPERPFCSK